MKKAIGLALLISGCVYPRSMGMGQTARMLGAGGASADASAALLIDVGSTSGQNSSTVEFPHIEGNGAIGLFDGFDLNVHLSPAGLQPGLKIALLKGPFTVSVLPQLGLLIVNTSSSSAASKGSSQLSVGVLAGVKVLASHEAGFFAAFGYDFQYGNFGTAAITGGTSSSTSSVIAHNLTFNVGYDVGFGKFHLRPELAFVATPALSVSSGGSPSSNGGPYFAFVPGVTLAVENPGGR
jgi:hypothetical protein